MVIKKKRLTDRGRTAHLAPWTLPAAEEEGRNEGGHG